MAKDLEQSQKGNSYILYACIVKAVKSGRLKEPFTKKDFKKACPNFGEGTYNEFLWKHRVGNPYGKTELFRKIAPGKFELVSKSKRITEPRIIIQVSTQLN